MPRDESPRSLKVVVLGLSITSSWGNGHATTWRSLLRGMARRGHRILFLERDRPWYADNRDLPEPDFCRTILYGGLDELTERHAGAVAAADLVIIGSFVPDGIAAARWVQATARGITAFYDIDTPVTLAALERGDCAYLSREIVPGFDLYLSFTGGPTLTRLERAFGARRARVLYCSADPDAYGPQPMPIRWDLGYLGTYSADRQPALTRLLVEPARLWPDGAFIVAGPQYPDDRIGWPANVARVNHLPPAGHRAFYNAQRFTLNVTRADMVEAGWSPSVRLFEAAACGVPILSDPWDGLDRVFTPGRDIQVVRSSEDVLRWLRDTSPQRARALGHAARARVLAAHTGPHRAMELEAYVDELRTPAARARAV